MYYQENQSISDTFSNASLNFIGSSPTSSAGLIIENNRSSLSTSYFSGTYPEQLVDTGALVLSNIDGSSITNSFWRDTGINGLVNFQGSESKTEAELQIITTYAGWNFSTIWEFKENTLPVINSNLGNIRAEVLIKEISESFLSFKTENFHTNKEYSIKFDYRDFLYKSVKIHMNTNNGEFLVKTDFYLLPENKLCIFCRGTLVKTIRNCSTK